ncbi:hypothetical protein AVM11_05210 [Sphingomonas melonis TY]|jgi:uncharacterized protein (DUF983 family)|uniref:Uncharacterized protein n=1 Tax=Sphingomonas melonis TY TaxID=621456 RepID=A0A175Y5I1_9SPHN|nr:MULTISPECIES: DUF983 domain-containing protein [Sphingomonas]AOW22413.1 hypothetical protein BJP26_01615 [Sphingomonas melonis TY]ATI55800.1 DUF983 domain-containing protein [Sphingomonas melonis]KZB95675.1 hypothetical protein AVM11_05210 [Sphingomonas melonis TY]MBI0530412.1 DUF983 domain-containing protein [Sphingomonas sp. TX0522]MBX8844282.1 DUF983 domain-containing protein [Sphingomonas melonis]
MTDPTPVSSPAIAEVALKGLCPRCGRPLLFAGWVKFADRCSGCGLDFTRFNVGDGPAAFLTLILGALVVAGAITLELTLHPPLWLHMLIWIPVTAAGVIWSLRVAKAALLAAEYRNAAREGRIDEARSDPTP